MAVEGAGKLLTFDPPQEIEQPARRKPGRPKGSPRVPGSGRKAGTPNRTTAEIRELIQKRGRPVELLCAIAAGRRVKVGRAEYRYPDLQERAAAARLLLDKLVPPPRPVGDETVKDGDHEKWLTELEQLEGKPYTTAHRIAYLLAEATQADGAPNPYVHNLPSQRAATAEPEPAAEPETAAGDTDQPTEAPEPQTEAEPAEPEREPPDPGPPAASYLAAGRLAWERELASQRALASRPTLEPAGPTERFWRDR